MINSIKNFISKKKQLSFKTVTREILFLILANFGKKKHIPLNLVSFGISHAIDGT